MDQTPRQLRKRDVENLLAAVAGPSSSALEEIAVVTHGLRPALVRVLGMDPEARWPELIDTAADVGAWSAERARLLHLADAPLQAADHEAVLDALWDLVRELNEVRSIDR